MSHIGTIVKLAYYKLGLILFHAVYYYTLAETQFELDNENVSMFVYEL